MADIQFDTAAPAQGLLTGFQGGLNAGAVINHEKQIQTQTKLAQDAAARAEAKDKVVQGLALTKESWVPKAFKMDLYNQSIKPAFKTMGIDTPELTDWPDQGEEASKEIHDIITKGEKAGVHPEDLQTMVSLALMKHTEEAQKAGKPVLESLQKKAEHQAKLAEVQAKNNEVANDRNTRFQEAQTTRMSATIEKTGIPEALTQFTEINKHLPKSGDIPGYGRADSLKPNWLAGTEGRALREAVQGLANIKIKDRSGAAVTPSEFVRFVQEFGSGKFKTEAEFRQGLQTALNSYRGRLKNALGGFTPDVQAAYYANNQMDNLTDSFGKFDFSGDSAGAGAPPPQYLKVADDGKGNQVGWDGTQWQPIKPQQ